jgi:hypothetical protein
VQAPLGFLIAALATAAAFAPAPASSVPAPAPAADRAGGGVHPPKIEFDPITYGNLRKRQMANYSRRHYGDREWRLRDVDALVLHYTASSSYSSAWNTFDANAPSLGEKPGVCARYVVDQDGSVYQLTRRSVRCRHTIGLNHLSIGIEMVQPDLGNPHETAAAILDRRKQANAAVRLASWLKQRYRIGMRDVLGHGTANESRLFLDKQGWKNDHVDWLGAELRTFRKRMARLLRD